MTLEQTARDLSAGLAAQANDMAVAAGDLNTLADAIAVLEAGGPPPPPPPPSGSITWPTGVNCIGGTQPSPPSLAIPGEADSGAVNLVYYDRLLDNMPDGAIPYFGDSITQGHPVCAASPFAINLGVGGESMRRCIVRMLRNSSKSAMERASAVILHSGVVDFGNTGYYGPYSNLSAAKAVAGMYQSRIKPWITGKWVIIAPLHRDERVGNSGFNDACDAVLNGGVSGGVAFDGLNTIFAGMSNVVVVDPNAIPGVLEGNDLATANRLPDGLHPTKPLYALLDPVIADALASLGVPGW